jgi:hypothetical protein
MHGGGGEGEREDGACFLRVWEDSHREMHRALIFYPARLFASIFGISNEL